jgi:hypothetical protein
MRRFLRNLVLWTKLLAVLLLLMVVSSFGMWGWFLFSILFCLWLGRSGEKPTKTTTDIHNKRAGSFPQPTKGYDCIENSFITR